MKPDGSMDLEKEFCETETIIDIISSLAIILSNEMRNAMREDNHVVFDWVVRKRMDLVIEAEQWVAKRECIRNAMENR